MFEFFMETAPTTTTGLPLSAILAIFFSFIIGIVFGGMALFVFSGFIMNRQLRIAQRKATKMLADSKTEAKDVLVEAKHEADKVRNSAESELKERRSELAKQENRVMQKTEALDRKLENLEQREQSLTNREKSIDETQSQIEEIRTAELKRLEEVANMTTEQAKSSLLEMLEGEMQQETSRRLREWEIKIKAEADEKAREVVSQAIQRCASDVVTETTTNVVPLPSDEMKGRLIGREGRNIRALEQATGVDLIIDDTPEAVTISSFDPVRREVARQALSKLIIDGRIHPARIEEVVTKAKEEVEAAMIASGEQAAYQAGVHGLRPEIIKVMGRLKYRTSYGQNVLQHSIEVAQMSGMIGSELGVNVTLARRAGFLHDIGKAVDRDVEGTHTQIGADMVKQWEKSPEVIKGVAEHHFDTPTVSIWGFIVSAADAISSARPGARRESLENYIKRLKALEEIADSFKGVEKSFAIQAGREVRIMVKPDEIDDLGAMRLARDIVKKIEDGLEYPGQIKVTVIRETRSVDFAK
ncbi:ribonuclease Y [Dehalococcoides mccartyi]|uniref:ribonuclease Y n=1 Tax=Dehalococcoides mccartyi TaxID=61435 RepID=UPI001CE4DB18|nr:ribonuclease Y [Dehalococcoides mccartyi]QYY58673.1 ribonuclease Y [Dehalococcoides mccartyi]